MAMNLNQLKKIVTQGESATVEFKKSTGLLDAAFKTVCAFLNGEGGIVLIGVGDKGNIVGQEISDKTRQEIAKVISELEPPAQSQISVNYVSVGDKKHVIAIKVEAGNHIPYTFDGRPFHRIQSTSSKMPQHRYEQLIVKRGQLNHAWDEIDAVGYGVDDLDHEEIRRTVLAGINHRRIANEVLNYDIDKVLHYLELLDNKQLTNAAVVLYAKKMSSLYSQCEIRMTCYRGTDKLDDFIDSNHVAGNAFKLLLEADYFIMRHLPVASFFEKDKGAKRIDKPALPVMAVREALINAICHRDYSVRNSSIALSIFTDRLEIWNNGILPPQLSIDDLKRRHDSFPRNKKIAAVFRTSGWVEKAGVGTTRMIAECKSYGLPEPEFEEYSSGLAVIFRFAEPIGIAAQKTKVLPSNLTARQKEILGIISKYREVSTKQILSELEKPPTTRMVRNDLNQLKKMGLIKQQGSTHRSLWVMI